MKNAVFAALMALCLLCGAVIPSQADSLITGQTLNAASSSASLATAANAYAVITYTVTGLTAAGATLTVKDSADGGANYFTSSGIVAPVLTADGEYSVNMAGRTNVELVVTQTGTGTVNVSWVLSAAPRRFSLDQALPPGANFIGGVGGIATAPAANFTMPTTGTSHANGSILCNTTVAPCADIEWQVTPIANGKFRLTGAVAIKNNTTSTNAAFRLWFYSGAPTLASIADGSSYSPLWADRLTRWGYLDCAVAIVNSDNVSFQCAPPNGTFIDVQADSAGKLHGWYQENAGTGNSYTAGNSEQWNFNLIGQPMASAIAN